MNITCLKDLAVEAKLFSKRTRVAVVAAHDAHTLEAIVEARKSGIIDALLIGDTQKIVAILETLNDSRENYTIVAAEGDEACVLTAIRAVQEGNADAIMKGIIETKPLMSAILKRDNYMRKGEIISHIGLVEIKAYPKLLGITDVAINPYPDVAAKREIIQNALHCLHAIGMERPKVAVIAAAEKASPKMPDSMEAAELRAMYERGEFPQSVVEGPISFDLSVNEEAVRVKGYDTEVGGKADLLVLPNIVAGNCLIKSLKFFANATIAGVVLGAKVPIILTSRSADAADKYYSIALAAVAAQNF